MPPKINRICPENKELNPHTGRCVKKCKDNRVRDLDTFKCVKNPKKHVVNPITGRLVKNSHMRKIKKEQVRILQAVVRRKITKGRPSSKTPEQYKRMSPVLRHSTSSASASSSASSSSASASYVPVFTPHMPFIAPKPKKSTSSHSSHKSKSSSLLGSPVHSPQASLSSASQSSRSANSASSPKHIMKFIDGKRKGEVVKIRRQR